MYRVGIDIGSTCAKVVVLDEEKKKVSRMLMPTGWSSVDTAEHIAKKLKEQGIDLENARVVATGYGRISVPYASKTVTEITCHAKGAAALFGQENLCVIDIGGQDTKIIVLENGCVKDFVMNDKCSAGTGRFLEVMANSLGMKPDEVCEFARKGSGTKISSMCTVFAESEVTSLVGRGESRENIAFAVVDSIADKVASQAARLLVRGVPVVLTGGLCECSYLREMLEKKIASPIRTEEAARYAGAFGAALSC